MKKFEKWLRLLCLLSVLCIAAIPKTARAVEIIEDPSAMITFKANVPEGFDENIALKIKNVETDITVTLYLADSVDYTRSTMILKNSPVEIEAIIEGGYTTDLEQSYTFSDVETVDFNVMEDTGEQQDLPGTEDPVETPGTEIPHGEESDAEMDELTGLESADSVWERFVSACSVMDGNPDFELFVGVYSAPLQKQVYLEDKETNTEEAWDAMTPMDRYIYFTAYYLPKKEIFRDPKSEESFVEDMTETDISILSNIKGGDKILDALEDLYRWHYKYYLHTGTFYDFYADAGTPLDGSSPAAQGDQREMDEIRKELSASEKKEIEEALEEESPHGEEKGGSFVSWIKNNIITLCILVVVGIALVVTTVVVKRKNMQDT